MNDFKFALRQLLKNPGFAAVAIITVALGIGATTALFSVVYGVLIKPYPYAKPEEIWAPGLRTAGDNQSIRSYRLHEFQDIAKLPAFSDAMGTSPSSMLLTGEFAPETLRAVRVTPNAYGFLGVPALIGRAIGPSDVASTGDPEPVVVLSFRRWQRLFGGDTNILGGRLRLDNQPHTIIGVMPPRYGWWTDNGVWLPLGTVRDLDVFPIARLKPGVTSGTAEAQLHQLHLEMAKSNPRGFPNEAFATQLSNYLDITAASGELQTSLNLLFGAVAFLLLIACANVANLQLAKGTARAREMAIRLSIGARRSHLIRQLLIESVMISLMGGASGVLFAFGITKLMVALMPSFYIPNEARIEVNGYVLAFCAAISVVVGIVAGLFPALQFSRPNADALKDESRGSSAHSGGKTRSFLVVTEVALCVVLVVSAALTMRSFLAIQNVELGFQPDHVISAGLPLAQHRYTNAVQRNQFARELLERTRNLPGVTAATIGNGGLPFGGLETPYSLEGSTTPEQRRVRIQAISAGYLRTLAIPLRQGRVIEEHEVNASHRVALINESAAKMWPSVSEALGRRIRLDELVGRFSINPGATNDAWVTVVGIIGNIRDDLNIDPTPLVLVPYTLLAPPQRTIAVRTAIEPATLMNALRAEARQMDIEQPLNGPTTFNEILGGRTAQPKFMMTLFTLFGALALALALAGIYSVLSYAVSTRTREIGVRMAIGASRLDIFALIFKGGAKLVAVGLVTGTLLALWAARYLASKISLFQTNAHDPLSYAAVILILAAVTSLACWLPARRATKVTLTEALRYE